MTHHVIREETPGEHRKLTPDEQRELFRLMMLGRNVTIAPSAVVVDTKASDWTVSAAVGTVTTDEIAGVHAELLSRADETDQ